MLKQGGLFAPISREGALVLNNLFLTTACLTVLVGTLYPLAHRREDFCRRTILQSHLRTSLYSSCVCYAVRAAYGLEARRHPWSRPKADSGFWRRHCRHCGDICGNGPMVFAGAVWHWPRGFCDDRCCNRCCRAVGLFREPFSTVRRRAIGLPRSAWGTALAHFGVAVTLLGIVGVTTWASERIMALKPSQTISLSGYDLTFDGLVQRSGPNYREAVAKFTVREAGVPIGVMEPSKRNFASRATTTTEAALMTRGVSQLYLSLGDTGADGSVSVRLYYKPMVLLIWLGAVVMAMGGALSLSDRRLRVGAPKPAAKPAMLPAE